MDTRLYVVVAPNEEIYASGAGLSSSQGTKRTSVDATLSLCCILIGCGVPCGTLRLPSISWAF